MTAPAFLHCESHPGRPLTEHLSEVRELLVTSVPSRFFRDLPRAGLYHDLAKATSFFLDHLHGHPVDQRLKTHALLSAVLFLTTGGVTPTDESREECQFEGALLYQIIRRHHGALDNLLADLSLSQDDIRLIQRQLAGADLDGMQQWLTSQGVATAGIGTIPEPRDLTGLRVAIVGLLDRAADDRDSMRRMQRALAAYGALIDADRDSAARVAHLPRSSLQFTHARLREYRGSLNSRGVEPHVAQARAAVFDSA
jgi:CRISPR-associated endonuclease Cas3-HD